jgi:hypothetical protein
MAAGSERTAGGLPPAALAAAVQRALQAPPLAKSPVATRALLALDRATREGRALTQYDLAESLYGDPQEVERARAAVRSLRRRLEQLEPADTPEGPRRLVVPPSEYRLELEAPSASGLSVETRRAWTRAASVLAASLVLGALLLGASHRARDVGAIGVRFVGRAAVARDSSGRSVWSVPLGHATWSTREQALRERRVRLYDADADSRNEALLLPKELRDAFADRVVLVDDRGEILLDRRLGRPLRYGGSELPPAWDATGAWVAELESETLLLVSVVHDSTSACEMVFLEATGPERGRFLHSGHLGEFVPWDADADGALELVLGGANNALGAAALVVLEPDAVHGSAPGLAGSRHDTGGRPGPGQRCYRIDPPLPLRERPYGVAGSLRVDGEELRVRCHFERGCSLTYVFQPDGRVRVEPNRSFEGWWRDQVVAGRASAPFDEVLRVRLAANVHVWEAGGWRPVNE